MALSFTAADRLAITRRQLNILLENQAYQASSDAFTSQQAKLLQVDQSNQKFYDYYNTMVPAYETEARALDGAIPATYSPSDLDTAAQNPTVAPFFPTTPTPAYARTIPLISDGTHSNNTVRGRFYPTGTDSQYEGNVLTNTADPVNGLTQLLSYLLNGISGSGSTTSTTTIPSGTVSGLVLTVASLGGLTSNTTIYASGGAASGIYKITATTPTSITISSILPATSSISSPSLTATAAGFTNTERQNLVTGGSYQMILTNLSTTIIALVVTWKSYITTQVTQLGLNNEDRGSYVTQNSAALTADNTAISTINAWQALSNTGVNGKFVNTSLSPIQSLITTRIAYVTSRTTEINNALGGTGPNALSQSGNTYSSTDPTNPYYIRYSWLNFRINRATGSLRRYYDAGANQAGVNQFLTDNTNIKNQYDAYFLTKALTFNDGSDILHLTDLTGLSIGNTLTAVSETQPELSLTILDMSGTTQVKVSQPVPKTYTLADKARVFKTL